MNAQPRTPDPADPLELRRDIAEELHPTVRWTDSVTGFAECPGVHLHRTDTTREAWIKIDGVATVYCHHEHCRSVVEEAKRELRSRFGKVEQGHSYKHVPTEADKKRWALALELRQVEAKAAFDLHAIIKGLNFYSMDSHTVYIRGHDTVRHSIDTTRFKTRKEDK